jgi:hypothetical protein
MEAYSVCAVQYRNTAFISTDPAEGKGIQARLNSRLEDSPFGYTATAWTVPEMNIRVK